MEPSQLDQQFYPIVQQALQGIAIYQGERVVYANPAAEKIIGAPVGRLTQYSHEEIFYFLKPEQRESAGHNIHKLLSGTNQILRDELPIQTLSGEPLWIEIYARLIQYQGHPAILVSYCDITQRKLAEDKNRQLAEEMKLTNEFIVEVSQMREIDPICRFLVRKVQEWNPAGYGFVSLYDRVSGMLSIRAADGGDQKGSILQDMIGQPLDTLSGMVYSYKQQGGMTPFFVSGKLEKVSDGLYPLLGGILSPEICEGLERELTIDSVWTVGLAMEGEETLGGLIIALPKGVRLEHHAALERIGTYVAVLLHRISAEEALFESEKRFGALFQYAADAMYIYSLEEEKFLVVNRGACSTWGYSRDQLLKMDLSDLIPEHTMTHVLDLLQNIGEKKQIMFETAYRHADGSLIPSDVHAQWIQYQNKSCVFAVNRDIRERKKNEKELREGQQRYRELSIHLQNVREEQNALIAREIHDELGQSLTALKMHLSMLAQDVEFPSKIDSVRSLIGEMKQIADKTVKRVRKLSSELWPSILDVAGIVEALENQVKNYEQYSDLMIHFESQVSQVDLNKEKSLAVYRIVQEAFTNVIRHAGATRVDVQVYLKPDMFCVRIQDNGRGFELAHKDKRLTFGILGMKERASMFGGSLDIISRDGKGTVLFLAIPLL